MSELQLAPSLPLAQLYPGPDFNRIIANNVGPEAASAAVHQVLDPFLQQQQLAKENARADAAVQQHQQALNQQGQQNMLENVIKVAGLQQKGELAAAKGGPRQLTAQQLADRQQGLADSESILGTISGARDLVNKDGVVGPGLTQGSVIGQNAAKLGALFGGDVSKMQNQRELEMTVSQKVLDAASRMKGSLSDKDIAFLKNSVPKLADTPATWNKFLGNWESLTRKHIAVLGGEAKPGESVLEHAKGGGEAAPSSGLQLGEGDQLGTSRSTGKPLIRRADGSIQEITPEQRTSLLAKSTAKPAAAAQSETVPDEQQSESAAEPMQTAPSPVQPQAAAPQHAAQVAPASMLNPNGLAAALITPSGIPAALAPALARRFVEGLMQQTPAAVPQQAPLGNINFAIPAEAQAPVIDWSQVQLGVPPIVNPQLPPDLVIQPR